MVEVSEIISTTTIELTENERKSNSNPIDYDRPIEFVRDENYRDYIITSEPILSLNSLLNSDSQRTSEDILKRWIEAYIFSSKASKSWADLYNVIRNSISHQLNIMPSLFDEIEGLLEGYNINNSTVFEFLNKNKELIPQIISVYSDIQEFFPEDELFLDLKENWLDDDQKIAIYIKTKFEPKEAFQQLKEFDKAFRRKNSIDAKNKLFINVEFQ